jgi:hypothetical protein
MFKGAGLIRPNIFPADYLGKILASSKKIEPAKFHSRLYIYVKDPPS